MPTTTRGYDYPVQGDAPNVPADLQALAESIDLDVATVAAALASLTTTVNNDVARLQMVVLTADQDRTSTTTLSNSSLTAAVKANKNYFFFLYCPYQAIDAADLKYDITFPAGGAMRHTPIGPGADQVTDTIPPVPLRVAASIANGTGVSFAGNSNSATTTLMLLMGTLRTAGTAGSITLRFAQVASSGTATSIKAGAALLLFEG